MYQEPGNDPNPTPSKLKQSMLSHQSILSIKSAKNAFDMSFAEEDTVLFEWYNLNFKVPIDGDEVKERLPAALNNDSQNEKEKESLYQKNDSYDAIDQKDNSKSADLT